MEIDLELPLGEEGRLDTLSNTDVDVLNDSDGVHVEVEDLKLSTVGDVSENAICCENVVDLNIYGEGVYNKGVVDFEPQNGFEFDSKEAAYSYYREYARSVGFGITIKASRRSKRSGKFIDVKIACSRFGNKRDSRTAINSRSCLKTDCKASMHVKRRQDGKWIIHSFVKEHNHDICPDDFYSTFRSKNKKSGFPCPKKGLQLALDEGDVQVMLELFAQAQDESPNFQYAIDLDDKKCLRNVFWVDAKARYDYRSFCDVVLFDTTYVVSKYKLPLIPIIGVNHHFQFMLIGCALIGDETPSTFVWLMQTWLRAVSGKAPRVVFTDFGESLKEAVGQVFSDARHLFCLWHALRKIPENLANVMNQNEHFMEKFNECIYQSWTDEQFEKRWWEMVDGFELRDDEWIKSLYEDRKKWVPTYMTDTFLAGMSTTERSDSIASFFDKYVQRETTLKDFFKCYRELLQYRDEEEAKADFETRQTEPPIKSSPFLKQLSTVYTRALYEKFQVEALGVDACNMQQECRDGEIVTYEINDHEQHQFFVVAWNETESGLHICCSCHSFEYIGFLCRHALCVLGKSGVSTIPSQYILKRWTNYAKIRKNENQISCTLQYRVQRFNALCRQAIKLGEEGSVSEETYNIVFHALEAALEHCVCVNNSIKSVSEPSMFSAYGIGEDDQFSSLPKAPKKRKLCKKRKERRVPEVMTIGRKKSSQHMEQLNARAQSLDDPFTPQQDMQEMEVCRGRNLDGFYGAQQSVQGVGQLGSLSPIRDGYYGNQHLMQGLEQLNLIPTRDGHYSSAQNMQGLLQGQLNFRAPTVSSCFDIQDSLQAMQQSMGTSQFYGIGSKDTHNEHISR